MGRTEDLQRWVDAGLIEPDTVRAIETFESTREGSGRVGRGMEAVAYLGAVLILVALAILATEFWDRIQPWGRLTLGVTVTAVLFGVGLILGRSDEPAVERAQTFAWLLTVAAVALSTTVALTEYTDLLDQDVFLYVSLVSLLSAVGLWWLRESVLQMLAMGAATGAAVIAVVSRIESAPDWVFGLAFAGVGLLWLLLTWRGVFKPEKTSYGLSGVGILLISFPEGNEMPWPLLGLAAALALMALSVRLGENVLLGLGVVGLFVYIPMTIFELFGESLGVPVALLITGLVLLGVVVATVRLRTATRPERPSA